MTDKYKDLTDFEIAKKEIGEENWECTIKKECGYSSHYRATFYTERLNKIASMRREKFRDLADEMGSTFGIKPKKSDIVIDSTGTILPMSVYAFEEEVREKQEEQLKDIKTAFEEHGFSVIRAKGDMFSVETDVNDSITGWGKRIEISLKGKSTNDIVKALKEETKTIRDKAQELLDLAGKLEGAVEV